MFCAARLDGGVSGSIFRSKSYVAYDAPRGISAYEFLGYENPSPLPDLGLTKATEKEPHLIMSFTDIGEYHSNVRLFPLGRYRDASSREEERGVADSRSEPSEHSERRRGASAACFSLHTLEYRTKPPLFGFIMSECHTEQERLAM